MRDRRSATLRVAPLVLALVVTGCSSDSTAPLQPAPDPPAPPPSTRTLTITGPTAAQVGVAVQLRAELKDAQGNLINTAVTWSSSASDLIAVSSDGTVTPKRIGSATITAQAGTTTATSPFTSSLAPYTFVFAAGTSASDQQLIRDGVQFAHEFHKTALARVIAQPTTVTGTSSDPGCAQGGAAAFTAPRTVTFCLNNPGWRDHGPVIKQKIVQHEAFHVWQFEYGWLSNPQRAGAMWLIEGAAELMGFRGIAARNLLGFSTAIGCQVKESADFAMRAPPGLPALSSVEARQAFQTTVGPLYTHSMLAADRLVGANGYGKLVAYADAITAGTDWPLALERAFGVTRSNFYTDFASYLGTLPVPVAYSCRV